jgi:hypothetical protein
MAKAEYFLREDWTLMGGTRALICPSGNLRSNAPYSRPHFVGVRLSRI